MSVLEILIIVAIVLLLFGGVTRLPAVGGALGRLVRNFKLAASSRDEIEVSEQRKDREKLQNGESDNDNER